MPQANLTATAALSPPVDTARTFLIFTANGGNATNGVESRYRVTVQRGSNTTAGAGTTTMNATISAIVTNRSVPIISMRGDAARTSNNDFDDTSWAAAITSTTNVQVTKSASASLASNATVAWEVVQFANAPNPIDGDGREIFP